MSNSPGVMLFFIDYAHTFWVFYNRFIQLTFYNIGQSQHEVVLTRL